MKQTAVEWLEQKIDGTINVLPQGNRSLVRKLLRQAKEMEKQQIIDAYIEGYSAPENLGDFEQYYNETFKNK
jgi:hypothetical protein